MSDTPQAQARRWYVQRISAMVLALLLLGHLALMIYAVHGGLSGAEILGRTQGNPWLGAYYGLLVLACALHVPQGLTNIAVEWGGWTKDRALFVSRVFGLLLLLLGWRAVYAVMLGGAA